MVCLRTLPLECASILIDASWYLSQPHTDKTDCDMALVEHYRALITTLLNDMAEAIAPSPDIEHVVIADHERDQYMLLFVGWVQGRRLLDIGVYLRIRDGKIWIEANYGPDWVAEQLVAAGIPRQDIVLGFQLPHLRALTDYAVA